MAGQFVIKQIAQEVIAEVNQPLYIGGTAADGSDAKITVASNGNVSTATPLTVPSLTVNSKPVMSSLLAEYTVTGSAVTSIDFSGLDINTHKSYRIEVEIVNTTGATPNIFMFVNNDQTVGNYWIQYLQGIGATASANRSNFPDIGAVIAGTSSNMNINLNKVAGYPKAFVFISRREGANVEQQYFAFVKTATVTNITQLTFTAGVANTICEGSKIRIYRGDV